MVAGICSTDRCHSPRPAMSMLHNSPFSLALALVDSRVLEVQCGAWRWHSCRYGSTISICLDFISEYERSP